MPVPMNEKALYILKERYLQDGEDWEALCRRVADALASVETTEADKKKWGEQFFFYLNEGIALPNSPCLVNLGAKHKGCAAACFSLQPEDNMSSIAEVARLTTQILKFGGGIGFELSRLRPSMSLIQSTHGKAMGPVGVMKWYNATGDMMTQGGFRKAALLGLLRVDHPDIIQFIEAKREDGNLANFNISVAIPDSFIKRLQKEPESPHIALFGGKRYLILPDGTPILKASRGAEEVLSTEDVWDKICTRAAENGDPGLVFLDHINRNNPLIKGLNDTENPYYLHGVNPCSEIALNHQGICVLVSIDLAKFVADEVNDVIRFGGDVRKPVHREILVDGKALEFSKNFTELHTLVSADTVKEIDTASLYEAFEAATRMADNMIDASLYPDSGIEATAKDTRRIGIGVMGFASMLDRLGIRYGSEACIDLIEMIGSLRTAATSSMSKQLASERGLYPAAPEKEKHRNIVRTTVPPTGSVAMLAGTSWSIEPHLYLAWQDSRAGKKSIELLPGLEEYISSEDRAELFSSAGGDLKKLNELIKVRVPANIVLAKDLTPAQHIDVVAAWQKHTDNSVSKTVNLPNNVTPEEVSHVYMYAWEKKLKGITVYPEGSRKGEPMSITQRVSRAKRITRPEILDSKTIAVKFQINGGDPLKAYVTIGFFPESEDMFEILVKHPSIKRKNPDGTYELDKAGTQFVDLATRLISTTLRYRKCQVCGAEAVPLGEVIEQLAKTDQQLLYSVPSILAKALGRFLPKDEPVGDCPTRGCGGMLTMTDGCFMCRSCGYSRCS